MRIVLVTDSHLAPNAAAHDANWRAARVFAGGANAELTLHLGDITGDGVNDEDHYRHALMMTRNWPTPIRFLPGNHDIGDNPPGPGLPAEPPLDPGTMALYRDSFGADHWALDAAGWRLIGLNAQLLGSDTREEEEQWLWLQASLDGALGRPVMLLSHKPLFHGDPADPQPHGRYVPLSPRQRLLGLLAGADWRIVVSGHAHQYLDRMIGGTRHIWLPSSAYVFTDSSQERIGEKIVGLGLIELTPADHRFEIETPQGLRRHEISLGKP